MNTIKQEVINNTSNTIGLFGGTFDPIHMGHITPLLDVAKQLNLSKIHLMPAHIPPHKAQDITNSKHRAAMVKLVCQETPLLHFDDRELKRKTPSYTVDTLKEISAQKNKPQLYFFIGMDSLINFTDWYQWQEILTLCQLIVMPRPGYLLSDISPKLQSNIIQFEQQRDRQYKQGQVLIMSSALLNISSTQIREKIKNHCSLSSLLSTSVIHYIEQHQLYR